MAAKSCKLLTSKEEIKTYLGISSDGSFKKFIEKGMPALYEDRHWMAHTDNIDEWMKGYTCRRMKNMPDDEEAEGFIPPPE